MHHVLLTFAAGVTVLATGAFMPGRAEALPLSASFGANLAVEALSPVENVALCFYLDGWNGPGFYECGFRRRQGKPASKDGQTAKEGTFILWQEVVAPTDRVAHGPLAGWLVA